MQRVGRIDEPPVPGHARLYLGVVGRIEPDDPAAPAEPRDRQLRRVAGAGLLGPIDRRVEIRHHLGIGDLRHDFGNDLLKISDLGHVALARVELGGDGQIAELGQPAAEVLDMFMDPEDFLHDEDDGKRPAAQGHCPVGRHGTIARGNFHFAGFDPRGVGSDRLGRHGLHRQRETRGQRGDDKLASREIQLWQQSRQVIMHDRASSSWDIAGSKPFTSYRTRGDRATRCKLDWVGSEPVRNSRWDADDAAARLRQKETWTRVT